MKNIDIIRRAEHALYVHFAATGETKNATVLRLDRGITIEHTGNDLIARYPDGQHVVLDSFPMQSLGHNAEIRLKDAVCNYIRFRQVAHIWKSLVKWIVAPAIIFISILALNATAVGFALNEPKPAAQPYSSPQPAPTQPAPTALRAPTNTPALTPPNLAKLLRGGVDAGNFTVQLSSGDKGTLYVFSDPACPHCRKLDAELAKLADEYTIHLYPVGVIGGDDSMRNIAKLLCADPKERAALWQKAIHGEELTEEDCDIGSEAASRNSRVFRGLRFAGVPTIINGDGEPTPDDVPNRAKAIAAWMQTTSK